MKLDDLGNRMKKYEAAYNMQYPIRMPLILRFDGVHFHSQVKKWNCNKPFDAKLTTAMYKTTEYLCKTIAGAQIAYTQSDEITLLIRDDMTNSTQPWFNKEINKVLSVAAAKATKAFIHSYFICNSQDSSFSNAKSNIDQLPEFDCRGYVVPENEIINAFIWRQQDCTKNAIQMVARSLFSHKQLNGKNTNQIQEMLWKEHSINWNDSEVRLKRGVCVVKTPTPRPVPKRDSTGTIIPNEFDVISRNTWEVDYNIPIFTQDKNYINRFAKLSQEIACPLLS